MSDHPKLNPFSSRITQDPAQGASQAMLHAVGLTDQDLSKPQVGIGSVWYEGNSCNMHLNDLAEVVKQGVDRAGMVGLRFNTIGVSDGISMGTDGMSFSLQSRDLIADSIETIMSAQWYDANVSIPGCDKNMPGCLMAIARLNRPSVVVYGGTIRAGHSQSGEALDIISAFQSYGEKLAKKIDEATRLEIIHNSCPGAGACGGMYTANTMATAIEAMGMCLPYGASIPAEDPAKKEECLKAGAALRVLMEKNIRPRDIMTRKAFENAIVTLVALGGSTNAVLHMLAVAHAAEVDFTIDDFQAISHRTPLLADLKPSGKYVMEDLHRVGGIPAVMKLLLERGLIDGSCLTVTGKTLAENLANLPALAEGQDIVQPFDQPLKTTGHLTIIYGTLAPEGSVAKITGKEGVRFEGTARVFDREESMAAAMERGEIQKGDVIVIRYEGPRGGPGMPEMLKPTSMIMGAGLGKDVALITDGRFSGGSHGFIVGHVCPEAQDGGVIALVENGDRIVIDAESRRMDLLVDDATLAKRRAAWRAPALPATRGTLYKYAKLVSSASRGCITDA